MEKGIGKSNLGADIILQECDRTAGKKAALPGNRIFCICI